MLNANVLLRNHGFWRRAPHKACRQTSRQGYVENTSWLGPDFTCLPARLYKKLAGEARVSELLFLDLLLYTPNNITPLGPEKVRLQIPNNIIMRHLLPMQKKVLGIFAKIISWNRPRPNMGQALCLRRKSWGNP